MKSKSRKQTCNLAMSGRKSTRKYRTKTKKRLRGTQLGSARIAKGAYGCVYQPALPCGTNRQGNSITNFSGRTNYVTKYLDQSEAEKEQQMADIIRRDVPAWQNIIVLPKTICSIPDPRPANLQNSSSQKCNLTTVSSPYLLQVEYGGIALDNFTCPAGDEIPFCKSIVQLIQNLNLLHSKKIFHLDIKLNNIVTLKQSDGTYMTRFIDLGFMIQSDVYQANCISDSNKCNWNLTGDAFHIPYDAKAMILTPTYFSKYSIETQQAKTLFISNKNQISGYYSEPDYTYLVNHVLEIGKLFEPNFVESMYTFLNNDVQNIATGIDTYEIGYLLFQLYINHVFLRNRIATNSDIANSFLEILKESMNMDPSKRKPLGEIVTKVEDLFGRIFGPQYATQPVPSGLLGPEVPPEIMLKTNELFERFDDIILNDFFERLKQPMKCKGFKNLKPGVWGTPRECKEDEMKNLEKCKENLRNYLRVAILHRVKIYPITPGMLDKYKSLLDTLYNFAARVHQPPQELTVLEAAVSTEKITALTYKNFAQQFSIFYKTFNKFIELLETTECRALTRIENFRQNKGQGREKQLERFTELAVEIQPYLH